MRNGLDKPCLEGLRTVLRTRPPHPAPDLTHPGHPLATPAGSLSMDTCPVCVDTVFGFGCTYLSVRVRSGPYTCTYMARFEMRVSEEWLERLDAARGDVPRASFVKRALERVLGSDTERSQPETAKSVRGPAPARASDSSGLVSSVVRRHAEEWDAERAAVRDAVESGRSEVRVVPGSLRRHAPTCKCTLCQAKR